MVVSDWNWGPAYNNSFPFIIKMIPTAQRCLLRWKTHRDLTFLVGMAANLPRGQFRLCNRLSTRVATALLQAIKT